VSVKRYLAVLAIGVAGGVKCLQAGEFCSHKAGYAAAYRAAGYKCKANGRLEEI
jgi:hypothetical protein